MDKTLLIKGLLGSLSKVDLSTHEHCLTGRMIQKPFGKAIKAEFPLQLIHSDICGPMNAKTRYGGSYFITSINDFSVYFISHKSEALKCCRCYSNKVKNQMHRTIKALKIDRGRQMKRA